jgi:hypothetical protein
MGLSKHRNAVSDPPASGWHSAFVIGDLDSPSFLVVDPASLRAWTVKAGAPELATAINLASHFTKPNAAGRIAKAMLAAWDSAARRLTLPPDLRAAGYVLNRLGFILPNRATVNETARGADSRIPATNSREQVADRDRKRARRNDPAFRAIEARRLAAKRAERGRKAA